MQRAEGFMHIVAGFTVGQQRLQRLRQRLRSAFILQQLFHQLATCKQVWQGYVVRFNQTFCQPEGKRFHAITDHHWAFCQHTLQRSRAGGQQRSIAGDHCIASPPIQ